MMECQAVIERLGAHVDGELESREAADVAAHLERCAQCGAAREQLMTLSGRIHAAGAAYDAPDLLAGRIRAAAIALPEQDVHRPARRSFSARELGVGFVSGLAVAALVLAVLRTTPAKDETEAVLTAHLRSLRDGLTQVVSTDQHNVKPWFNGRVDLSPPVPDLSAAGFTLVGGRVDTVDAHAAAVVVYDRRLHHVNLFVWPVTTRDSSPVVWTTRNGFHFATWREGGLALSAVSDINEAELAEFVKAVAGR